MQKPAGRLLIVEDDPAVAALLMKSAMDGGYEVLVGKSNEEFEPLVQRWQPTVISIDVMMPGRDGLDLVRALIGIGFQGSVIIVTGAAGAYLRAAEALAKSHGLAVAGVLQKPFRLPAFRALLSALELRK